MKVYGFRSLNNLVKKNKRRDNMLQPTRARVNIRNRRANDLNSS